MVVLVHGSGALDRDETVEANAPFRDLAHGLASRGIGTIRYDKRTLVHPGVPVNIEQETIDDALSALAMAHTLSLRVYLLGHSLGAMLAPLIASRDMTLSGVVMLAAPARSMPVIVREQIDFLLPSGSPQAYKDSIYDLSVKQSPQYFTGTMATYNAPQTARSLSLPMLVMQGERDYQVRMTDYALWQEALAGKQGVTFRSYPRLNHLMMDGGGDGISTPVEYLQPCNIPDVVLDDISAFVWNY